MLRYTLDELHSFDLHYDHNHNYCGPEGAFRFPRTILLIDCNYEYFLHDRGYKAGGSPSNRRIIDRLMYECLKLRVTQHFGKWNPLRYVGYRMARNRYLAVRFAGAICFGGEGSGG